MSGKKCIFALCGLEKWPAFVESVFCFRPEKRNRQFQTRRMKEHDAHLFCRCLCTAHAVSAHNKTAWEYCLYSFLVGRLAMPVFQ